MALQEWTGFGVVGPIDVMGRSCGFLVYTDQCHCVIMCKKQQTQGFARQGTWLQPIQQPSPGQCLRGASGPAQPATRQARPAGLTCLKLLAPAQAQLAQAQPSGLPSPTDPRLKKKPIPAQSIKTAVRIDHHGSALVVETFCATSAHDIHCRSTALASRIPVFAAFCTL